jgi:hypothetical protein
MWRHIKPLGLCLKTKPSVGLSRLSHLELDPVVIGAVKILPSMAEQLVFEWNSKINEICAVQEAL